MATDTKAPSAFGLQWLDRYRGSARGKDASIERQVRALIDSPQWHNSFSLGVTVEDRVVRLEGTCLDADHLQCLEDAIAAMSLVEGVESEVEWAVAGHV